jgi:hypothetical protein
MRHAPRAIDFRIVPQWADVGEGQASHDNVNFAELANEGTRVPAFVAFLDSCSEQAIERIIPEIWIVSDKAIFDFLGMRSSRGYWN